MSEVDDYIDALDAPHRRLFDHVQDLILDELPDAEVVFSYQIPMYKVGRQRCRIERPPCAAASR